MFFYHILLHVQVQGLWESKSGRSKKMVIMVEQKMWGEARRARAVSQKEKKKKKRR